MHQAIEAPPSKADTTAIRVIDADREMLFTLWGRPHTGVYLQRDDLVEWLKKNAARTNGAKQDALCEIARLLSKMEVTPLPPEHIEASKDETARRLMERNGLV